MQGQSYPVPFETRNENPCHGEAWQPRYFLCTQREPLPGLSLSAGRGWVRGTNLEREMGKRSLQGGTLPKQLLSVKSEDVLFSPQANTASE